MLPTTLLDVLVCPRSKQGLVYFAEEGFLFCPASRLRYRVDEGVPVMLVEEAVEVAPADAEALLAMARARGLAIPA